MPSMVIKFMMQLIYFLNILTFLFLPNEPRSIRFLHRGPNDVPFNNITISLEDIPSKSFFEYVVVVNEKTFNEVESYVKNANTHLKNFKKENEYNFRIEQINKQDTTYYLLSGQRESLKYFNELKVRINRKTTHSEKLNEQLKALIERIELKHKYRIKE